MCMLSFGLYSECVDSINNMPYSIIETVKLSIATVEHSLEKFFHFDNKRHKSPILEIFNNDFRTISGRCNWFNYI